MSPDPTATDASNREERNRLVSTWTDGPSLSDPGSLLPYLGDRASVLQPRRAENDTGGGGDLDCAVQNLDALWPLRLPPSIRLCQSFHYDVRAWYWVLEERGRILAVDTLADPTALGRYGFPTNGRLFGPEGLAPAAARAAYLTVKRLRKERREAAEWEAIGRLARTDPPAFVISLGEILRGDLGESVSRAVLAGVPPDRRAWRAARRGRAVARMRSPGTALRTAALEIRRLVERVGKPTGLTVLIVGPDGAGKTTLASALPGALAGCFRRSRSIHWRPGLLPRPGAVVGSARADPAAPHARPPHGALLSLTLLAYYWTDFQLGHLARIWGFRRRSGLVVIERGWWDLAVDPRRYRIAAPRGLVELLGRLLPRPDLVLALEGGPSLFHERKAELAPSELARQLARWREVLPSTGLRARIDAALPSGHVLAEARERVVALLERRAVSRLGAGWAGLPTRRAARWTLPRGRRDASKAALLVYQPVTVVGRVGWEAARVLAGAGAFRLLPRSEAPPRRVRELLGPHLPPRGTFALMKATHPNRFVALALGEGGKVHAVAKIATDEPGEAALAREAAMVRSLAPRLLPPVRAPRVLAERDGLLLLEAIPWRPRLRPWVLPEAVAFALGALFRSGAPGDGSVGPAHGDAAPWNLLRGSGNDWVLADWEHAREAAPPFFDLFHYIVQAHALLGRPTPNAIVAGLDGAGWVGKAVRAYSHGGRRTPDEARASLIRYLREEPSDREPRRDRRGVGARRRLLIALEG